MLLRKTFSLRGGAAATLLLFAFPQQSNAQFLPGGVVVCANCADEPTSLAMKAEQVLQYAKEVETALNTYNHLQLMIREVQQLAEHPSTNIALDLATFSRALQSSAALAMDLGQMNAIFQANFAPFTPTPLANFAQQYSTWASTALHGLHAAANSAASQGNMIQNEQLFMAQLNRMNQQTNGLDQGLQIGNAVGLETVAQLQRLRMLTIANIQQNAAIATTVLNAQQANVMTQANQFKDTGLTADQRGW